jgi:hypothetical protein
MPYTEKQKRLFRAVAHGWKPSRTKGPSRKVAKKITKEIKEKGYSKGGPLRSVKTGFRTPDGPGPRASLGALGVLGSPARIGGLGGASGRSGGFGTRPVGPPARPLSLGAGLGSGSANNASLRPRPGRGVNALLATAGIPYHEATSRLSRLRRGLGTP